MLHNVTPFLILTFCYISVHFDHILSSGSGIVMPPNIPPLPTIAEAIQAVKGQSNPPTDDAQIFAQVEKLRKEARLAQIAALAAHGLTIDENDNLMRITPPDEGTQAAASSSTGPPPPNFRIRGPFMEMSRTRRQKFLQTPDPKEPQVSI